MKGVILLMLLAVANAKPSYLILVPETITPSKSLSVEVNAMEEDFDVELKLQSKLQFFNYNDYKTQLSMNESINAGETRALNLPIPKDFKKDDYILRIKATINGTVHENIYPLKYEAKFLSVFIQTDKAIYKPGTTVNFRAFAIYSDLMTYTEKMTVEIFDPSNNKLKQMLNVSDPTGVITNSLKLSKMPIFGHWKIKVTLDKGHVQEKTFEVANYKLPRFEVKVELPSFMLLTDHNIEGKVTATYTFGEPVKGVAEIHAKIPPENTGTSSYCACEQPSVIMSFPIDGEGKFTIPTEEIQHMRSDLIGRELTVEAFVTETLTGKKLNGSSTSTFYGNSVVLKYLDYSSPFKPGLKFTGHLMVSLQDNLPIPSPRKNVTIDVCVRPHLDYWPQNGCAVLPAKDGPHNQSYALDTQTLSVPPSGLVQVNLDVPSDAKEVVVFANYGKEQTKWTIKKAFSPSDSFVQLELQEAQVNVGDEIDVAIKATEPLDGMWYHVTSNGKLVDGQRIDGGMKTKMNLKITATREMTPHAQVIVYYIRDDGEIVADGASIDVKGLFANQVSVGFSANQSQPHEKIDVIVKADPQSLVSLLVVDQSVTLLASGNDITQEMVESALKVTKTKTDTKDVASETGADQVFKDANIRVFTNGVLPTDLYKAPTVAPLLQYSTPYLGPTPWPAGFTPIPGATPYPGPVKYPIGYTPSPGATPYIGPTPYALGYVPSPGATPYPGPTPYPIGYTPYPGATPYPGPTGQALAHHSVPSMKQVGRVRTLFPETWLWTNTTVGDNGTSTIQAVVPDTVTSWLASAFAVNPVTGLGVTSTKSKLRVFRPFFVSLDVPMTVIRGEQVVVRANVFNYLPNDLDVMVTMTKSDDYVNLVYDSKTSSLVAVSADQFKSVTVPSNGASTVDFPIVPNELGQLDIKVSARSTKAADAVKRKLTVEAEGIRKETNVPVTIDLLTDNSFNETVYIALPNYIVKDSQKIRVRAFGDVLSPSLEGLDSLLKMPTGCGEQNMMGLAPDVYVTNYLMQANKFTGEIEARVMPFMEEGYHRELGYQHEDASFSAWGNSDPSGSTWLTAFVAKTFVQARNYVFIDDEIIGRAVTWLLNYQRNSGEFYEAGRILDNIQGGSGQGAALTAYVLDALLDVSTVKEIYVPNIDNAIRNAIAYLEHNAGSYTDSYTLAIIGHSLAKAQSNTSDVLLQRLEKTAIKKDKTTHWESSQGSTNAYWRPANQRASAIDIETAGYVLKTHAIRNDFTSGFPVMKWLTTVRNPSGGFISTQDTVVALDGLASFAGIINSNAYKVSADISSGSFTKHFDIDEKSATALQVADVPQFTGSFDIHATGHGIGHVEFAVFFNVEKQVEDQYFEITHAVELASINMFTLRTCVKYIKAQSNNMAVVEVTIPSGFEPDMDSIGKISNLQNTEEFGRQLVFYFNSLSDTKTCMRFTARRNGLVAKMQASPIRVYDYYEPTHQAVSFYQPKVLQSSTVCDVCPECCKVKRVRRLRKH